jgi:hypothetical protein
VLAVASPGRGKAASNQLNVDAVADRVVHVCEPSSEAIFKPRTIFQAYLTAYQLPSELGGLCEALFAFLWCIDTKEAHSSNASVNRVSVYDSSYVNKLAVRTENRGLRWLNSRGSLLISGAWCIAGFHDWSNCRNGFCDSCFDTRVKRLLSGLGASGNRQGDYREHE